MRLLALLLALSSALPSAAHAQDLLLRLPIDCTLGAECDLQQFVDADPGPGARDRWGGPLTYDGHGGTDLRVTDLEAMAAGVPVRAPADGTVVGTRDGEPDRLVTDPDAVTARECGNGVRLDHGNGWETQLCHMARGSVAVRTGDRVAAGDVLGAVGLSGLTQFPHVHLSVERGGATVDPFEPGSGARFDPPVTPAFGGLLSAGFAAGIPDYADVKAGTADAARLPPDAPALVVWAYAFGGRAGDSIDLRIAGPDGAEAFSTTVILDRTQAELFRAAGRRGPWAPGTYRGEAVLRRDGAVLDRIETTVEVGR